MHLKQLVLNFHSLAIQTYTTLRYIFFGIILLIILNFILLFQAERLTDFFIEVCNNSYGNFAQLCAHNRIPHNNSETRVYTCPSRIFGQYVRVRFLENRTEQLELCEVQIQGGEFFLPFHNIFTMLSAGEKSFCLHVQIVYLCACYIWNLTFFHNSIYSIKYRQTNVFVSV